MKRSELLSPAGNMDAFSAALNAGADAIYLGGEKFGARAYADNFTKEEILKALDLAHLHDRRVYLTVNTLLKDEETEELYDYIYPFYINGLDGVIIQDPGVISVLGKMFPKLPLHASTQMAVTGKDGVDFLKERGISRVVLARELSLKEIEYIYKETGIELECFIHGALCYAYSGKCLMSSFIGGRSGNRGRCAGACRLPYPEKYYLSARDICTLSILPQLVNAGISSLKIEGRMKGAQYVGAVTGIYRKHLDRLYEDGARGYRVDEKELSTLLNLYTRSGNSEGYYHRKNGRDMITITKPSYEVTDQELSQKMFMTYSGERPYVYIDGVAEYRENEPSVLKLWFSGNEGGCEVCVKGDIPEAARNNPMSGEEIRKSLEKTGGTEFVFRSLKVNTAGNIFVPKSRINALRRSALEELRGKLLAGYRRDDDSIRDISGTDHLPSTKGDEGKKDKKCRLHIMLLRDTDVSMFLQNEQVDIISVSHFAIINDSGKDITESIKKLSDMIRDNGKRFYLKLPSIIRKGFTDRYPYIRELTEKGMIDGIIADDYESLKFLKDISFKGDIITDIHLYGWNRYAEDVLKGSGERVNTTVPIELNKRELYKRGITGEDMIVYGYLPMMLSAQCIKKTKDICDHRPSLTTLKDRLFNVYPVECHCSECINVIYNNVPLFIDKKDGVADRLKPSHLRLMFLDEDDKTKRKILDHYSDILSGKEICAKPPLEKYTKGHLNRGVE